MSDIAPTYRLLDDPLPSSALGGWAAVTGPFTEVVGWTGLGDPFVRDPASGHYAVLMFDEPRMVVFRHRDPAAFGAMLAGGSPFAERMLRRAEVEALRDRLGLSGPDEAFAPHELPRPRGAAPYAYRREDVRAFAAREAAHHGVGRGAALDPLLRHLRWEDDPALWRAVLGHVLSGFCPPPGSLFTVGCCSHWLRPHQTRWTADGGFAAPIGYGSGTGGFCFDALPQFDWSVTLTRVREGWAVASDKSARPALRLTVPSRTKWHAQAAVHAVWSTGREKEQRRYGFRKAGGVWGCTAETEWAEDRGPRARRGR